VAVQSILIGRARVWACRFTAAWDWSCRKEFFSHSTGGSPYEWGPVCLSPTFLSPSLILAFSFGFIYPFLWFLFLIPSILHFPPSVPRSLLTIYAIFGPFQTQYPDAVVKDQKVSFLFCVIFLMYGNIFPQDFPNGPWEQSLPKDVVQDPEFPALILKPFPHAFPSKGKSFLAAHWSPHLFLRPKQQTHF